jgi:hypothetical protein
MNAHPESRSDGTSQPPGIRIQLATQQANRDKFMTPQLVTAPRV